MNLLIYTVAIGFVISPSGRAQSDVVNRTMPQVIERLPTDYYGDKSQISRFSSDVRAVTQRADTIFAESIESDLRDIDYYAAAVAEHCQAIVPLFDRPNTDHDAAKRVAAAIVRLLADMHAADEGCARVVLRLRHYAKPNENDPLFVRLSTYPHHFRQTTRYLHSKLSEYILQSL